MKRYILPLLLLLMATTVFAPPSPMPVFGLVYLQGVVSDGIRVEAKNLVTGKVIVTETVSDGTYSFDGNEFTDESRNEYAYPGQQVEIKVCEGVPACKKLVRLSPDPVRYDVIVGIDLVKEVEVTKEVIREKVTEIEIKEKEGEDASELKAELAELQRKLDSLKADLSNLKIVYKGEPTNAYALYIAIGLAFFAGILGMYAYYVQKGQKSRAKKMLKTVLDKAGKDQYNKPKKG